MCKDGKGTKEEHRQRHVELHQALDELLADWIYHTGCLPGQCAVRDLIAWSYTQTQEPTEVL